MHPAPSIILFTVLSGAGFAALAALGLAPPHGNFWQQFAQFALGFGLAVSGLLCSTLHLGNPQRALKAFSQWRTSWLSREGCLAVFTLALSALYACAILFKPLFSLPFELHYIGWLSALLSVSTIFATAMIYAQLKTVPAWNSPRVPALFLAYALSGGAILGGQTLIALWSLGALALLQITYWRWVKSAFDARGSTIESATALGFLGKVRQFEPPHTGSNYLLKEMVFAVARKHCQKLKRLSGGALFLVPLIALALVQWGNLPLLLGHGVSFLSYLIGAICARWLFFAEARHTVGLYYDQNPAE